MMAITFLMRKVVLFFDDEPCIVGPTRSLCPYKYSFIPLDSWLESG